MIFGQKESVTLNIGGMHCAHCRARVESALKAVPGVTAVAVSLDAGTATVCYRAGKTNPSAFIEAVQAQGFEARL